jgi:hypothetical protein
LDIDTYLEEYEMSPESDNAAPTRELPDTENEDS